MTITPSTPRRLMLVLFAAQGIALAGLFTATAVASLTGVELAGTEQVAGLPSTITLIAGALAAYPAGRLMGRAGRRVGLSVGYACGMAGSLIAGIGVLQSSFAVFLAGMALLGASRGITDLARYAAADMSRPDARARAVSTIVFAGTIGAVLGPVLATYAGGLAVRLGYAELSGPLLVGMAVFAAALIFVSLLLRPDPRDIARALQATEPAAPQAVTGAQPGRSFRQVVAVPAAQLALVSLGLAQAVMVMVMVVTPVHMRHSAHALSDINLVLAAHVLGMFGLSPVTGRLADRWGQRIVIGAGSLLLILACLIAPWSTDVAPLTVSMFLLGLGWNLCFVAGSSLLTGTLSVPERPRMQGAADRVAGLAAAAGSLASGFLLRSTDFATVALIGACLALVIGVTALRSVQSASTQAAPAG